jgi:hypothetical protein
MTLAFHPLADIFPLMEGQEFDDLVADIKAHGLIEPIVLFQGQILDGRNRYRACEAVGAKYSANHVIDVAFDPLSFVISRNLKRRHLNESQRAMIAARLATLKRGDNQYSSEHPSIEGSSKLLNVGHASVERAKAVQKAAVPELIAAVDHGKVSVSAAADIATQPPARQCEIVALSDHKIVEVAKEIRAERAETKRNDEPGLRKDRKLEHFIGVVSAVHAHATNINEVQVPKGLTAEKAAECVGIIEEAIKGLRLFKNKLAAIAQSHESQIDAPRASIQSQEATI